MRLRACAFSTAVILATITAGCGGEPAQRPGSAVGEQPALAGVDACSLLQDAEIREATGAEPGTGARPDMPEGAPPMCHWAPVQLLVSLAGWKTYEEYVEANSRIMGDDYDPADYEQLDAPGRFTVVLKGAGMVHTVGERYMVQVAAQPSGGGNQETVAARLAGIALDRLE
jgi:hypothetical protein